MRLAEQKLPVVGDYFVRDIPPSDNVSALLGSARRIGANGPVYSRSDIFANEKRHMRRALVADSEAFLGGEGQRVGVVHKIIDCCCWVTSFYDYACNRATNEL